MGNALVLAATSAERHVWIEKGTAALRKKFTALGYEVPEAVRVSIGWPKGNHGKARAIGQCWSLMSSDDAHNEIFISPELGHAPRAQDKGKVEASVRILGVLAHEMVHAVVGTEAGHRAAFKKVALAIGLEGKMTATTEAPDFVAWAKALVEKIGQYPAGRLRHDGKGGKKQSTRMLKCQCGECGYTVRLTKKWLEVGEPICPVDDISMVCDNPDEEGDD